MRFASGKAVRTGAVRKPYFHFANYQLPLKVRAKVTRHGKQTYEPTPPECEPDCGTKRVPWQLQSGYFIGRTGGIYLQHESSPFNDPYRACPVGGVGFPDMLTTDSKQQYIRAKIKEARFFDRRVDTIVVHAAGKKVEKKPDLGIDRTATVDWKITFHRVEKDR